MPTAPIRELMSFSSYLALAVKGEGEGKQLEQCVIKGFASVATNDRSGDYTDPFEFNVDEFMAAPTLLVNHHFWTNNWGNQVAAGRVLSAFPAKLVKIDGDSDNWGIYDLKKKEVVNTFPKVKVPSLSKGDQGLFVTAEVTVPEVISQIANGELGGMSWRGLVEVSYRMTENNTTQRALKDIDLYEISVVHIPDHNQSTFVVGKSAAGGAIQEVSMDVDDAQLWKVQLSKTRFVSKGMAEEYLKAHKLDHIKCVEDADSFTFEQRPFDGLNPQRLIRFKMGEAYMWMASPLEKPKGVTPTSRLVAELVDVAKSSLSTKESHMADSQAASTSGAAAATTTPAQLSAEETAKVELEKKKKMDEEEAAKAAKNKTETQKSTESLEVLGNHISASVASALKPALEQMATGMASLGEGMKVIAEKMASTAQSNNTNTKTETKTDTQTGASKQEVTKSAEKVLQGLFDQLNTMAENQKNLEKQMVEVAKSAIDLGKSIPNAEVIREEAAKTEVEKSALSGKDLKEDPNGVLDGAFAFLGGK